MQNEMAERRLAMFLEILVAAGGQSDAGDWLGSWINALTKDQTDAD